MIRDQKRLSGTGQSTHRLSLGTGTIDTTSSFCGVSLIDESEAAHRVML